MISIEIKARRIQFLNKFGKNFEAETLNGSISENNECPDIFEDDSFDKFLTNEESQLLKEQ